VVVHGRQVVMHQRIGVDQLDRAGGAIGLGRITFECFAGGVDQQRAHALAAVHHAVAHGLVETFELWTGRDEEGVQAVVDARLAALLIGDHASGSTSKGVSCSLPSRSSRICTFCSAWLRAAWQSRVRPMPCSKQVSESSSDSSPLSSRSTSCCSSARDCSKSRATFLRAMAEPVLCGSSETVATLAELGGKSSGQGQAASIKTLK